jgi:hypothetical protein
MSSRVADVANPGVRQQSDSARGVLEAIELLHDQPPVPSTMRTVAARAAVPVAVPDSPDGELPG